MSTGRIDPAEGAAPAPASLRARVREFFTAFSDLLRLPAAFWVVNIFFMVESMGYFGVLTLMDVYLPRDLGISDHAAGLIISVFTGLVTIFMLGIGSLAERLGVRNALLLAVVLATLGRTGYSAAPLLGWGPGLAITLVIASLAITAVGEAITQPVAYAGVKAYTDKKTSAMGYGLIYALMNLGIFFMGLISPAVRVPVDDVLQARQEGTPPPETMWTLFADRGISGVNAVNWVCMAITAFSAVLLLVSFRALAAGQRSRSGGTTPDATTSPAGAAAATGAHWSQRVLNYFVEGPFRNLHFIFFIFMLLPVQTLFAHQWLTMPAYVLRAYPEGVSDRMEWIVNWINPGVIFFGVPILTALTRKANVYTLMIAGSALSALPTFLLAGGPSTPLLIVYLVLFSVGEALWSPRFLQYAAELAPEGKVAQYMGLANIPWLLAKSTTGIYSGMFLGRYCAEPGPAATPHDTGFMWLVYGLIAISSPIGLLLGRGWVMRGTLGHADRPPWQGGDPGGS